MDVVSQNKSLNLVARIKRLLAAHQQMLHWSQSFTPGCVAKDFILIQYKITPEPKALISQKHFGQLNELIKGKAGPWHHSIPLTQL